MNYEGYLEETYVRGPGKRTKLLEDAVAYDVVEEHGRSKLVPSARIREM